LRDMVLFLEILHKIVVFEGLHKVELVNVRSYLHFHIHRYQVQG
jgi:hypothetical protein